ncbi:MAG: hypothetical protein L0H84_21930, partial [Pseudonocardia sp.]|nr:hypothetical protein [Pseudonocardia sp.]
AEVIEIQTGQPVDLDTLDVVPSLAGEAGEVAAEARRLRAEAHAPAVRAGEQTRAAVELLHRRRFPLRDIGRLTGITYQRAQQIVKG